MSFPRASWNQLLASSPAIVAALDSDGTTARNLAAASLLGDGSNGTRILAEAPFVFNGTNWDRVRSALNLDGTAGTGAPGSVPLLFDGGAFRKQSTISFVSDANAGSTIASQGGVAYNESTYDRLRNNVEFPILSSAVRAITTTTSIFSLYNAIGFMCIINVTVNPGGAQTLTLNVRGYGNTSILNVAGIPAQAWAGAAGSSMLVVYPGIGAGWSGGTGNAFSNTKMPRRFDITVTPSGAGNWTYSVDGLFVL